MNDRWNRKYSLTATGSLIVFLFLLLLFVPVRVGSADSTEFSPYIESHPNGWIDWDNGFIYGVGRGYLHLNKGSRSGARRSAHVIALQSILKVAAGIRLDDYRTLEMFGKGPIIIELKALIHFTKYKSDFIQRTQMPYYEITLRSPLKGIEGLYYRLLSRLKEVPHHWRQFPKTSPYQGVNDADGPWLIIDARSLSAVEGARPALFPKIVSTTGETLYDLSRVHEKALVDRGMANYVITSLPHDRLGSDKGIIDRILAGLQIFLPVREAVAGEKGKRKRFIVKEARNVQGLAQTNLVLSETDVRHLKTEDESSQILKNCRVIVIVSSSIGGG